MSRNSTAAEVHMGSLLKPVQIPRIVSLTSSISTAPLILESSSNLMRVHSIPLSMLVIKLLNTNSHSMEPRGTTFINGFHTDCLL